MATQLSDLTYVNTPTSRAAHIECCVQILQRSGRTGFIMKSFYIHVLHIENTNDMLMGRTLGTMIQTCISSG